MDCDAALVAAARSGATDAFGTLAERHRAALRACCRRVLRDPSLVEEVEQEALLQALLGLHRLRQPASFGAWLVGIGLKLRLRLNRSRRGDPLSWEAVSGGQRWREPADVRPGPEQLAEAADMAAAVHAAIAELPAGQREAVLLVYLSGLTHVEAASLLAIEPGAIKARLFKARTHLKRRLAPEEVTRTMIDVTVADVRRRSAGENRAARHLIYLRDASGRLLPIWVGEFEASSIVLLLDNVEVPRPMTHTLMATLLQAGETRVREVRIDRLVDETYYATIELHVPRGPVHLQARPSDAIALALATGAPIRVAEDVLAAAGRDEPLPELESRTVLIDELQARWAAR